MKGSTSLLGCMVAMSIATMAGAAEVAYDFTALQSGGFGPANAGSLAEMAVQFGTLTGRLSYDTDAPITSSTTVRDFYATGSFSLNELDVSRLEPSFEVGVANDFSDQFPEFPGDSFLLVGDLVSEAGEVGSIFFTDETETIFSSKALPASLNLADFTESGLFFQSLSGNMVVAEVDFDIVQLLPVPLPGGLAMDLAALSCVGAPGLRRGARWLKVRASDR